MHRKAAAACLLAALALGAPGVWPTYTMRVDTLSTGAVDLHAAWRLLADMGSWETFSTPFAVEVGREGVAVGTGITISCRWASGGADVSYERIVERSPPSAGREARLCWDFEAARVAPGVWVPLGPLLSTDRCITLSSRAGRGRLSVSNVETFGGALGYAMGLAKGGDITEAFGRFNRELLQRLESGG